MAVNFTTRKMIYRNTYDLLLISAIELIDVVNISFNSSDVVVNVVYEVNVF
jgi:hypothetical protein